MMKLDRWTILGVSAGAPVLVLLVVLAITPVIHLPIEKGLQFFTCWWSRAGVIKDDMGACADAYGSRGPATFKPGNAWGSATYIGEIINGPEAMTNSTTTTPFVLPKESFIATVTLVSSEDVRTVYGFWSKLPGVVGCAVEGMSVRGMFRGIKELPLPPVSGSPTVRVWQIEQ